MSLNRRGFLASLVAAATLDPERLLWTPGKKMISVPAPRQRDRYMFGRDIDASFFASLQEFNERFVLPSIQSLSDEINREALATMAKPRMLKLQVPMYVDYVGTIGPFRCMRAFDLATGKVMARVDALVEM